MRTSRAAFALLLLSAVSVAAPREKAPVQRYLAAAIRLYENLEYEQALGQLDRARKASPGVESDVLISLYEGIFRAELRQEVLARGAFKSALFLDPEAKLPLVVPPKVSSLFEEVQREVREQLPKLEHQTPVLTPPPKEEPAPVLTPQVTAVEPSGPTLWPSVATLAAGAVAGGVGVYFGTRVGAEADAARAAEFQDDARLHLDRAGSAATGANVAFAVAGAAVVTSVVLYFVLRD